jgi:hypothetical protein
VLPASAPHIKAEIVNTAPITAIAASGTWWGFGMRCFAHAQAPAEVVSTEGERLQCYRKRDADS